MSIDSVEYAGFWIRVAASLIDSVLVVFVILPPLVAIYGWSYLDASKTGFIAGVALSLSGRDPWSRSAGYRQAECLRGVEKPGHGDVSRTARRPPAAASRRPTSSRASAGPVPDSSCLKYTNASRHSARAAVLAHSPSSSGP